MCYKSKAWPLKPLEFNYCEWGSETRVCRYQNTEIQCHELFISWSFSGSQHSLAHVKAKKLKSCKAKVPWDCSLELKVLAKTAGNEPKIDDNAKWRIA